MDQEELKKELAKLAEQMDFFNGEIGRLKTVLQSIKDEITETEVKKATAQVEFDKDVEFKNGQIQRLEDQITLKKAEAEKIGLEIGKNELVLEDRQKEMVSYKEKMESDVTYKAQQDKLFNERNENLTSFEQSLKDMEIDIARKNLATNERVKILKDCEDAVARAESLLVVQNREMEAKEKRIKRREELADETIRAYEGKNIEIDKRETALNIEKTNLAQEKISIETTLLKNQNKEKELKDKEELLDSKESDYQKRESSSIKRETDVILREAECRVREKALNIANREKQLDTQI